MVVNYFMQLGRLKDSFLLTADNLKDFVSFERRLTPMVLHAAYGVDTFFVLR